MEALEEEKDRLLPGLRALAESINNTDVEALLDCWRMSVRTSSDLDEALVKFFIHMNAELDTGLSKKDLEDRILRQWGRAFAKARFQVGVFLGHADYISKLEELVESMRVTHRLPVLASRYNKLSGIRRHLSNVDTSQYNTFFSLTGPMDRTLESLHFICGDSGSGKTHFALHAASEMGKRYSSSVVPFYIYTKNITGGHTYKKLVCEDENVNKYCKDGNEEEEDKARAARDELAKKILVDAMESLTSPYRLLGSSLPTEGQVSPYAIVILDEAIHSMPLLHALTSKGNETAVDRLNAHYKTVFQNVFVIAASTASKKYVEMIGSSRDKLITFNMVPGIELLREGLTNSESKLEALFSYWLYDQFFITVMNNRRCTSLILYYVSDESTASIFKTLNSIFVEVEELQGLGKDERKEKGDALIKKNRDKLVNMCIYKIDEEHTPHYPFKDLTTEKNWYASFAHAMLNFTAWLSVEAVVFYKSQNGLADLTSLECRDIVMRGVFLCVTGNVAKLHPERRGRLTEEDPIVKGVATVITDITGKKENDKYSIGLHQIAMAMIDYFGEGKTKSAKDSNLSHTLPDDALKNLQGFLTFGGQEAEAFFCHLLKFLCECVFEARVRKDALSLLDILYQFVWPGPSAVSGRLEALVSQKVNNAASDAKVATMTRSEVVYPTGDNSSSKNSPEDILNEFCKAIKEEDKTIRIVLNKQGAPYADVVVVCGDVLLLVSVKRQQEYGSDANTVRGDIATLGFDVGEVYTKKGNKKNYSAQRDGTKNLAKELGCKYAVPVLALFKEPSPQLEGHLPLVKVRELRKISKSMKPVVLYIKPTLEHVVTSGAQSQNSSE